MSTNPTPGPWYVGGSTGFLNQTEIGPTIGCAYGAGAQVRANARLIAAAPELLNALRALYLVCIACAVRPMNQEEQYFAAMDAAEAAIDKATEEGA